MDECKPLLREELLLGQEYCPAPVPADTIVSVTIPAGCFPIVESFVQAAALVTQGFVNKVCALGVGCFVDISTAEENVVTEFVKDFTEFFDGRAKDGIEAGITADSTCDPTLRVVRPAG